jgi:hypothetical protein
MFDYEDCDNYANSEIEMRIQVQKQKSSHINIVW